MMRRRALHVTPVYFASACVARCIGDAQPSRSAFAVWCIVGALCVRCSIGRRPGCCGCRAAARCARAQIFGGVLSMAKGTALFDAVAISGTEALVRAGPVRRCAVGAGVGGRGATADCNGRGWVGWCAVGRWRRGEHARWGRHVQGRLDLGHQGGGACARRESRVRAPWYGMLRGAARPMGGAHGAAHACCGEWCTVYGAWSRSGACEYAFRIIGEGATPSGRGVLHSNARAACAARCACARHAPRGEAATWPKPRSGPVPPRCMRYRMRRCGMRCAGCTGLRCVLHRRALYRSNTSPCMLHKHVASMRVASVLWRALRVASVRVVRCIGARWRVASVRVACCVCARCMLHRCAWHRRALHRRALRRRVASACVASACVASACVASAPVASAPRSRPAAPLPCDACLLCVRCSIGRRPGCCGCRAAARCARAQSGSGGVLSMDKGTALFDTVAISGPEAKARTGLVRRCAVGAGVGGRGARTDCNGRGWVGCAQFGGGVVRMDDGAVTFKGGSISNSIAVRACAQRESRVRAPWYGMLRGAARPMDGAQGACCGEWSTVCGACCRSGACEYAFRIVGEGATHRDAERCTATSARRALHDARALVMHRVARFPNGRMDASRHTMCRSPVAARCRQDACGTGCVVAVCDVQVAPACVACCIGTRCIGAIHRLVRCINMSHRCMLHRCIGARCMLHRCALYVASARVGVLHRCALACCIGARCMLHRCAWHRRALHRRALRRRVASACFPSAPVASACVASAPVASACVASAPVASAPRNRPAAPLPCDAL
jgi:hypothetical protein